MLRRWALALIVAGAIPCGAGELDVLEDLPNRRTMLAEYLARQSAAHEARRDEEIAAIRSIEHLQRWQHKTRLRLIELLGGLPQPTPLNARVVGRLERGDYRVEKVIFESQPRFYVTANLYLPAWKEGHKPVPGFIAPVDRKSVV